RVINVDRNPAYPVAVEQLKQDGMVRRRCRVRQCKYLNNMIEQDHRTVKRRVWLAMGYGSFRSAWRTLRGIEAVSMIRKGRARWVAKTDPERASAIHSPAIRNCRVKIEAYFRELASWWYPLFATQPLWLLTSLQSVILTFE